MDRSGKFVTNSGFKVSDWVQGSHMTLVPDPFYNGPHKPYLEKVIHPFQDASAATILPYESDEVDIAGVDVTDLERILRDPALKDELVRFHAMNTWYMFFRTQQPPFNDVRVREAVSRSLDREKYGQCDSTGRSDSGLFHDPARIKRIRRVRL
jgi:oligopeptide transport system substrate-binding protein